MRLLRIGEGGNFSLVEFTSDQRHPPYAILSHTWRSDNDEYVYEDIKNNSGETKLGYSKIRFCAKQAKSDRLQYFWVDSCCINKESSAELTEAINSMFSWYRNAAKCYVYLSDITLAAVDDVGIDEAFQKSRWFTRGWTLQELLAPQSVEFFTEGGERIGNRSSLSTQISRRTSIPINAIRGASLHDFCVHERMSWAQQRTTKREEDSAYCLLGIFDVNLPLLYGEGKTKAILRLREQINKYSSNTTTIQPGTLAIIGISENLLQFIDWLLAVFRTKPQKTQTAMDGINIPLSEATRSLRYQAKRIEPSAEITRSSGSKQCLLVIAKNCIQRANTIERLAQGFLDGKAAGDDKARRQHYKAVLKSKGERMTLADTLNLCWEPKDRESFSKQLIKERNHLSEVLFDINESTKLSARVIQGLLEPHEINTTSNQIKNQDAELRIRSKGGADTNSAEISLRLSQLREESQQRHLGVLEAIDTFVKSIGKGQVFPVLPSTLTQYDPSLKSLASNGYSMIENAVLEALWFRRMSIRKKEISDAYQGTCAWIFNEPAEADSPHDNFNRWLREGQGIFWIGGKAGCGKSTLLNFLLRDGRTTQALREWCGSHSLITASYFFWLAGSTLQKNQEGLLRSLLHYILSQRRSLISRVFPMIYNAMMARLFGRSKNPNNFFTCNHVGCGHVFQEITKLQAHHKSCHQQDSDRSDTEQHDPDIYGTFALAELREAFLLLMQELPGDTRIVCFIDGLDEYYGHHQDIISLFSLSVAYSPNIKLVVSSRPEAIFVESFQRWPKLRVEDLTRGDIEHYVRDNLFAHERMLALQTRNKDATAEILNAVMSKSSGVFLWVFLIVRSLVEGLIDGSTLEELLELTEEYPRELQDVYRQMFARMKDNHRQQAFCLMSCIARAQMLEDDLPTLLRLSLTGRDPLSALQHEKRFSEDEVSDMLTSAQARVRSRCCGLLEANNLEDEGRISYLHRTVSEFVKDMTPMLEEATEKEGFDPSLRLMTSIILKFKARDKHLLDPSTAFKGGRGYTSTVDAFFINCQRYSLSSGSNPVPYVREFDRVLSEFWDLRSNAKGKLPWQKESWMNIIPALSAKVKPHPKSMHLGILARHYGIEEDMRRGKLLERKDNTDKAPMRTQSETPAWAKREPVTNFNFYADMAHPDSHQGSLQKKSQLPSKNKQKVGQGSTTVLPQSSGHATEQARIDCARCKASQDLSKMGFRTAEIDRALREAGVGTNIQALVSWLVEYGHAICADPAGTSTATYDGTSHTQQNKKSLQDGMSYAQAAQKSTVVAASSKSGELMRTVAGTNYEPKIVPAKSRMKRSKKIDVRTVSATQRSDIGSIEMRTGTFTWIFEPGLSAEQTARLQECLSSMDD